MKTRATRSRFFLVWASVTAFSAASCAHNPTQSTVPGLAPRTVSGASLATSSDPSAPLTLTTDSARHALSARADAKLHGQRYFVIKGPKGSTYVPKNARFLRTSKALVVYAYNTRLIFPLDRVQVEMNKFATGNGKTVHMHARTVDKNKFRFVARTKTDAIVNGKVPVREANPACADCLVVARPRRRSGSTATASARRMTASGSPPTIGRHVLDDGDGWDGGDDPFYYDPGGGGGGDYGGGDGGGYEDSGNYVDDTGEDIAYIAPNVPPSDPWPCIPGTYGCDTDPWPDDPSDPFFDPFGFLDNYLLGGWPQTPLYVAWSIPSAIYMTQVTPSPGWTVEFHLGFQNKVQSEHYFCATFALNAPPVASDQATPGGPGANFTYISKFFGFPWSGKLVCQGLSPDLTTQYNNGAGYFIWL